ncbi:hypothetical protein, partial [Salmonella sp. s51090]|uniref:hypothetical protein n=1 Tax=Salmonella sp. s51090 TaxID=3159651 RepID=UPI00398047C2
MEFPEMGIPGWYAASIMVEDFKNKKSKEALSTIPFQFLLNVTAPGSCVGPLVQGPACDIIRPGEKWTGIVTARILPTSDAQSIIAMPMSPPAGMKTKITTSLPNAEAAMKLEYQAGRKEGVVGFCYTALDNNWVQSDPVCGRILISKTLSTDTEDVEPAELLMDKSIPTPGTVYGNRKGETPMPKKWRLVFNKPVSRPRKPAFVRLKYAKGANFKELAKFNFADENEVAFLDGEESARIEFLPPMEKFKDGVQYFIEIDAGTAIVYKPDPCGNAPAESPNPGLMVPF